MVRLLLRAPWTGNLRYVFGAFLVRICTLGLARGAYKIALFHRTAIV